MYGSFAPVDDNNSAPSCQQALCKLFVKTFYLQGFLINLQISSYIKTDFHRLHAT